MKKKGFTLIELLAVIVILSIIAIITVPMIMNVIDKAKLGALEDSAYGLIESANLYYAKNMDHIESYTLFEIQDGKQTSESKLDFKGKIDGNAKLVLTKEGKVALCLTSGKTYAKKEIEESKVTTASVSSDTTCTIPNLADNDFTISIEGSSGNYYDKDAIDIKINDLQTKIDNINNLKKLVATNQQNIVNLTNRNNYSTEEQMIGKWIDGKSLYRKTLILGDLEQYGIVYVSNPTGVQRADITIDLNIDKLVDTKLFAEKLDGGNNTINNIIKVDKNDTQNYTVITSWYNNPTKIFTILVGLQYQELRNKDIANYILTLEYTKKAD